MEEDLTRTHAEMRRSRMMEQWNSGMMESCMVLAGLRAAACVSTRQHSQVVKAAVLKAVIAGSNLGAASTETHIRTYAQARR